MRADRHDEVNRLFFAIYGFSTNKRTVGCYITDWYPPGVYYFGYMVMDTSGLCFVYFVSSAVRMRPCSLFQFGDNFLKLICEGIWWDSLEGDRHTASEVQ